MHKDLRRLTSEIRQAARDLRHGYDPARLYEFRVAIRRVRSMLKHRGSKRARRLRRTWGGFAAVTNRARDWDVFLAAAEQLLGPADLEEFKRAVEALLQSSRDAVTRMLESARWQAHQKEWKRFLRRARQHDGKYHGAAAAQAAALEAALARARDALATALQQDDDSTWHKFRIAVKEVRYTAEREPHPTDETAAVVDSCKALQSLLGSWHDGVIQLQLLNQLQATTPTAAQLLARLRDTIAQRRQQRLAELRQAIARHPLFRPPGASPDRTA